MKAPATHRAATKPACDTSPCPTSPTELACYRASVARPNASPCSSKRTPSIKLSSHVMLAAQPASSNCRVADVEAYHHRWPRPTLLACQSVQRGLGAGSRGPLNENDFGPTFVRHESIEGSQRVSAHITLCYGIATFFLSTMFLLRSRRLARHGHTLFSSDTHLVWL